MKKIFLLLLIALTCAGCGSEGDKPARVGTLTQLNTSPDKAVVTSGGAMNFFDNFNSMQMALASNNIDRIQTYSSVAKYLTANNSDFAIGDAQTVQLVDNFCCAMRAEDVDLKNSFDGAIAAMKSDGTLNALVDKFINNPAQTPDAVAMPHTDGAKTIKVGVTGDLPPLDLVLADGTPAGFNTAVLAEIGKRTSTNIELVQIDSASRAAALTSKLVDVVFWVVVPADDSRPKDFDTPAGVAVTQPYWQDSVVDVNLSAVADAF